MRKCKSDLNIVKHDNKPKDIGDMRVTAVDFLQNSSNNYKPGTQIKFEYEDFSEKPIYIRTNVQSCSNFSASIIPSYRSGQITYVPRKLSNDIDIGISSKSDVFDDSLSSSSSVQIEEWRRNSHTIIKQKSFAEGLNSYPKTFSGVLSNMINNLFENPDGRMTSSQRVTILLFSIFEAYRTIISSFLTVFVPQNCDGYSCTILQNIIPRDNVEVAAISVNTFMAFYFCTLFTIERIRENVVKEYLLADKSAPTNKEYLIKMLSDMHSNERNKILNLNRIYRAFAQGLLLLFFANAGISCFVVQKNYLNNTTITVFITNTLFMINRIHKALKITSSGEYNVYSAYRTDNLIYNRYRGEWLQDDNLPGIV